MQTGRQGGMVFFPDESLDFVSSLWVLIQPQPFERFLMDFLSAELHACR